MIVNFTTQNDEDFIRAFVLSQAVPVWDSATFYPATSQVTFAGQTWTAAADNTDVTPGSDGTKWTIGAAPKVDLTGSTLSFMARSPVGSKVVPLSASTVDGNIDVTDAANGAFTLKLAFAQLSTLPPGQYAHSLIQTNPAGERLLVWTGTITHAIGANHV